VSHPRGKKQDFCTSEVQKYQEVPGSSKKYQEVEISTPSRDSLKEFPGESMSGIPGELRKIWGVSGELRKNLGTP
jgi:hypothetical protein